MIKASFLTLSYIYPYIKRTCPHAVQREDSFFKVYILMLIYICPYVIKGEDSMYKPYVLIVVTLCPQAILIFSSCNIHTS